MPKLSVTIITKDEERHIGDALAAVSWADERIVVDAHSSDRTVAIARAAGARVLERDWPGYIAQKNYAASQAANDWILSIDADERVTPELARDIQRVLQQTPSHSAYAMSRLTWHLGRWIRGTDWYPDRQTRLYDRRAAEWTGRYVHEGLRVNGSIGQVTGDLQHFAYDSISDHLETIDRYTTDAARQMQEDGRRASAWHLLAHGPLAFLRNYVLKGGWRLGGVGVIVSAMNAHYVFLKYAKLWRAQSASAVSSDADAPGAAAAPASRADGDMDAAFAASRIDAGVPATAATAGAESGRRGERPSD